MHGHGRAASVQASAIDRRRLSYQGAEALSPFEVPVTNLRTRTSTTPFKDPRFPRPRIAHFFVSFFFFLLLLRSLFTFYISSLSPRRVCFGVLISSRPANTSLVVLVQSPVQVRAHRQPSIQAPCCTLVFPPAQQRYCLPAHPIPLHRLIAGAIPSTLVSSPITSSSC